MKRMKQTRLIAVALALAVTGSFITRFLQADTATARSSASQSSLQELAGQAIDSDPKVSKAATDKLRVAGPAGLSALLSEYDVYIKARRSASFIAGNVSDDKMWPRITAALDAVAAQHDAYASGLYWYTDFPSAQAAARSSGKPILSLRLLGNLSDEYSCANSRFFRTVLYANTKISKYLRENFILHWQSVRPVPVITIDFGDGRIIRRTITGNSIHYVLTADGHVMDAIPGLYGPKAFLRELDVAMRDFIFLTQNPAAETPKLFSDRHAGIALKISSAFDADIQRVRSIATPIGGKTVTPTDLIDADWSRIAALHSEDAKLDQSSVALMSGKVAPPDAAAAARVTASKTAVESQLIRVVANFQRSIAEDTVRNEYLYHLQIHRWLADPANGSLANDVNALNSRVYAELFLTPDSDPWLGLVSADTYTGLDRGGVCH